MKQIFGAPRIFKNAPWWQRRVAQVFGTRIETVDFATETLFGGRTQGIKTTLIGYRLNGKVYITHYEQKVIS